MYRAKVVAEEGRKLRPNQTTPAMQKHTHMMKRTLGCPALRTGTVGYQLSPHTHTPTHNSIKSLDYYNSTPYMYIHMFGCNKIWSFCRADLQGYFILHFRVTDHIHVCTCTLRNMFTTQTHNYLLVVLHVLYTLYKYKDVKDSQQNYAYTMWGVLET